ncbi:hypothetical protein [Actinocorallia aurantiaca]|uniref:Uncharacterized protein n=1 Tax=Actinocorallia aurantiaca TaxID=46204 RepID=A0ABN3UHM5_9ACTN
MTTTPQSHSLRALRAAWSTLAAPALTDFEGDFQASFVGAPLRAIAPRGLALVGLPRWYGKRFTPPQPGADAVQGVNLLNARDGGLEETLPMTATIGASLSDGRPALIVAYSVDSRLPWRWVRDEFRVWDPGTFLGMTFVDLPPARRAGGTPFMLTRAAS